MTSLFTYNESAALALGALDAAGRYPLLDQSFDGGIEPGSPFFTIFEGFLVLDGGSTDNYTATLHVGHAWATGEHIDATRTYRVRINRNEVISIPLNVFNSVSEVPLGTFTDANGDTVEITRELLATPTTIAMSLELARDGGAVAVETLTLDAGEVHFHQLGLGTTEATEDLYVSVPTFKAWATDIAGYDENSLPGDSVLTRLLRSATTVAIEHCKRRWIDPATATASTRTFWPSAATGTRMMVGAATDATAVAIDGTAQPADDWALIPAGDDTGGAVLVHKRGRWSPPASVQLTATYDAGDVPANVVEAICRIVKRWIDSAPASSINDIATILDTGVKVSRSWRDPDVLQLLERSVLDYGR